MPTVPEFLRHDLVPGEPVTVILRSGYEISGVLEGVDLTDDVLRVDGWTLRVEEVAGARCDAAVRAAA
jgi:hypothetical protein